MPPWGAIKSFWGKNLKICSLQFVATLVVECRKPHLDILKTVEGDRISGIQELRKRETEISPVEIFLKKPKNGHKS